MKYLIKKFFKIKMKPLIKKLNTNNDLAHINFKILD